jgi:hypothetical protein
MTLDIPGFAYAATVAAGGILGYVKSSKFIITSIITLHKSPLDLLPLCLIVRQQYSLNFSYSRILRYTFSQLFIDNCFSILQWSPVFFIYFLYFDYFLFEIWSTAYSTNISHHRNVIVIKIHRLWPINNSSYHLHLICNNSNLGLGLD